MTEPRKWNSTFRVKAKPRPSFSEVAAKRRDSESKPARKPTVRKKGLKGKRYGVSQKPRKPLGYSGRLKAGKKTKAWNAERRRLKADSERNGRTTCELRGVIPHECTYDNFLGYAHSKKRRKIEGDELSHAILICNNAHDVIEFWPAEEMKRIVNDTIAARREAA